jgi:histidinol-phosphate aminotransferase
MTGYTPGFQPADSNVVKLNTNENPYPPSPKVIEAIRNIPAETLRKYPPILCDPFRQAAAQVLGVDKDMIACGNGGDELLAILTRCCCDKDHPLAYPVSTYSLYPILAQIQDASVIEIPFGTDYQIPAALKTTGAGLTILCNPNAPSGTWVDLDAIADLAGSLDGVLLIDEAYVDFSERNCLSLLKEYDNIVILRSLSKGYSLAGLRFGFVIGSPRIIEAIFKVKDSYNVNAITQVAATAAMADQDYFQENVRKVITERERLTELLRNLGFQVAGSQTNFLLAQISTPAAKEVYQLLQQRKIFVRYFEYEGLRDKLRITVGTPQQNDALLNALDEIIN